MLSNDKVIKILFYFILSYDAMTDQVVKFVSKVKIQKKKK